MGSVSDTTERRRKSSGTQRSGVLQPSSDVNNNTGEGQGSGRLSARFIDQVTMTNEDIEEAADGGNRAGQGGKEGGEEWEGEHAQHAEQGFWVPCVKELV